MARKIFVRGHVRKGDVAVSPHERKLDEKGSGSGGPPDADGMKKGLDELNLPEEQEWVKLNGQRFPRVGVLGEDELPPALSVTDALSSHDLSGLDLRGANFSATALNGVSFAGSDLRGADFSRSLIDSVDFSGANLEGVNFSRSEIKEGVFDGASFGERGINLQNAKLEMKKLSRVPGLENSDFHGARLSNIDFSHVNFEPGALNGLLFFGSGTMEGASLPEMNIRATFSNCSLRGVNAQGADFSYSSFRTVDGAGANMSGSTFESAHFSESDFSGVSFTESVLRGSTNIGSRFQRCDFSDVDARGMISREGHFCHSNMSNSDFSDTIFERSSLRDATFANSNFSGADFAFMSASVRTNPLDGSAVPGSDLRGVNWEGANFTDMNFSTDPERKEKVAARVRSEAVFEKFSAGDVVEAVGCDKEEVGVLIWGGIIEAVDARTGSRVEGSFNLDEVFVPAWSFQNLPASEK